jgi:spermidine synthase
MRANTVGAAIGVLLGGFVLLPALGMRGATGVAVALNVAAALLAWRIAAPRSGPAEAGHYVPPVASGFSRKSSALALSVATLTVSGFVALVYEVAWTRILAMVLGPTTYAVSAMLVAFISGLAIGAAATTALLPRIRRPGRSLANVLLLSAAVALAASAVRRPAADSRCASCPAPGRWPSTARWTPRTPRTC